MWWWWILSQIFFGLTFIVRVSRLHKIVANTHYVHENIKNAMTDNGPLCRNNLSCIGDNP